MRLLNIRFQKKSIPDSSVGLIADAKNPMKTRLAKRLQFVVMAMLVGIFLFLPVLTAIITPAASADANDPDPPSSASIKNGQFTWWDRNTIHANIHGKVYYFRANHSGSYLHYDIGDGNSACYGQISFDSPNPFYAVGAADSLAPNEAPPNTAKVDMDWEDPASAQQSPGSNCQNTTPGTIRTSIGDKGNFDIYFRVSDSGRQLLTVGDDGNNFTQSSQYADIFLRDSESGDSCQDIIQVNANNSTYKLYEIDQNGDGGSPPASIHAPPGCKVTGHPGYVKMAVDQKLGNAGALKSDPNPGGPGGGGGGGGSVDNGAGCPLDGSALSWIICPVVFLFQEMIKSLDSFITSQLSVGSPGNSDNPNQIFCDSGSTNPQVCQAYKAAWASFRNIALGLVVIASLVIVISEMAGLEFLDAYTIRKVLPRLIIATLAIVLSWQLLQFFVTLTNDLGYGVRYIILQPFKNAGIDKVTLNGGGALLASGLFVAAGTLLAIAGLFSFLLTAALSVLVAFLVLMIRQVVVIMLILVAPIAIVLYIMPNTNRFFRLWWDSFAKALLMFPMIVGLITAGRVFAATSTAQGGNAAAQVIGFAAYFAPYFMIPLTFRFAGGIMGGIGNAVNQRAEGGRQFLRQFRSNQAKTNAAKLAAGTRLHEDVGPKAYRKFAERFNRGTAGAANLRNAGYNPYHMKDRMAAARSTRLYEQSLKAMAEDPDLRYALSNDDIAESLIPGVESYRGSGTFGGGDDKARRQFLQDRGYTQESGLEEMVAAGRAVSRKLPTQAVGLAAWTADWSTGTGFSEKEWDEVQPDGSVITRKAGGSGEAFMALAEMTKGSNGGDQMRANIIAKSREGATQQRRSDFYGMSFTEQMLLARDVAGAGYGAGQTRGETADAITERVRKGATWGKSRGEHITGRPQAIKAIVPQLEANFDQILANAENDGDVKEFMQELGMAAAGQQAAGQASPENAKEHAKYMNHEVDLRQLPPTINAEVKDALYHTAKVKANATGKPVSVITVQDMVDANRGNRELTALVYQYGNEFAAANARAQAEAAAAGGAVPPPIPPPAGATGTP